MRWIARLGLFRRVRRCARAIARLSGKGLIHKQPPLNRWIYRGCMHIFQRAGSSKVIIFHCIVVLVSIEQLYLPLSALSRAGSLWKMVCVDHLETCLSNRASTPKTNCFFCERNGPLFYGNLSKNPGDFFVNLGSVFILLLTLPFVDKLTQTVA